MKKYYKVKKVNPELEGEKYRNVLKKIYRAGIKFSTEVAYSKEEIIKDLEYLAERRRFESPYELVDYYTYDIETGVADEVYFNELVERYADELGIEIMSDDYIEFLSDAISEFTYGILKGFEIHYGVDIVKEAKKIFKKYRY